MGRRGFSLEFGRGGSEGLGKELDENIIEENNDPSNIIKIMDEVDTWDLEDDEYSDCAKEDEPKKEDQKEEEEKENFSDCLKKSTKTEAEKLRDDVRDIEETKKIVKDAKKEIDDINDFVKEVFG